MLRWLRGWLRRREELRRAIAREAGLLRVRYGEHAYKVAKEQAGRDDLTTWGRAIKTGALAALKKGDARKP